MSADHPEPAPDAEKPVAGQQQRKAGRRHQFRLAFDRVHWEVGYFPELGAWSTVSTHDTPEAAAIAATRLNGNEPEVDGGVGTV